MANLITISLKNQKQIKNALILGSDQTKVRIKLKGENSPVFVNKSEILCTKAQTQRKVDFSEYYRISLKDGSIYNECKILDRDKDFLDIKVKRKREPIRILHSVISDISRLNKSGALVKRIAL